MAAESAPAGFTKNTDSPTLPGLKRRIHSPLALSRSQTIDIYPGKATTFAGDGQDQTVDSTWNGTSWTPGSFKAMGGAVVVNGNAYVATSGAVRKVDLSTGQVSTLAGSATQTGCVNSSDPSAVRFSSLGASTYDGSLDGDGTYLYMFDQQCEAIRRITITTGATTQVAASIIGPLTLGPDGYLYVVDSNRHVLKIDPSTGTSTTIYTLDSTEGGNAITSDDTYLWVSVTINVTFQCGNEMLRIPIAGGQVYRFTLPGDNSGSNQCGEVMGTSQLVSAGNYLYASIPFPPDSQTPGDFGVERIMKPIASSCGLSSGCPMAIGTIVGGGSGYADGEWGSAQFNSIRGMASGGSGANPSLWVADSGNYRLRRVVYVPVRGREFGPAGASQDGSVPQAMSGDPVSTANGNFSESFTDVSLPGIGLPFTFTRYYNSMQVIDHTGAGRFGTVGWTDSFDASVEPQGDGGALVFMPTGQILQFTPDNLGGFSPGEGVYDRLTSVGGNVYRLTLPDQTVYEFDYATGRLNSIKDRNSNQITLHWTGGTSSDHVDYITDTVGRQITFTYDPNCGYVSRITLPDGRYTEYTYSTSCQLSYAYELDADGANRKFTHYSYPTSSPRGLVNNWQIMSIDNGGSTNIVQNTYEGASGRVASQTIDGSLLTTYSYSGNTTTATTNGHTWTYAYSTNGLLQSVSDPSTPANVTNYQAYDANDNPQTVIRPGNQTWTYTYNAFGAPLTVTPPVASNVVTYTYNPTFQTLPASYTDGIGNVTRWEYGTTGDLSCELLPTAPTGVTTCAQAAQADQIDYTYDANHELFTMKDQNGHTTTYNYFGSTAPGTQKKGLLQKVTTQKGLKTTYDYNSYLQQSSLVTPQGNAVTNECQTSCTAYTWTYTYDDTGRLLSVKPPSVAGVATYTYDAAGNVATKTDADGHTITYGYSASGKTCYVLVGSATGSPSCSSPPSASTSYAYDADGHLWKVTDPNAHTTTYAYYANGELHTVADPLSPPRVWSFSQRSFTSSSSTVTETLPSSDTVTTTSDAMGRVITRAYTTPTDPSLSITATAQFGYDKDGNLCYASTGASTVSCSSSGGTRLMYDQMNRLCWVLSGSSSASCQSPPSGSFRYAYDPTGNLTTRTYPDGTTNVSYTYDGDNRLCGVVFSATPATNCTNGTITFAYAGLLNQPAKLTKDFPNGETVTTFDKAGRLTEILNKYGSPPTTTLSDYDPQLDDAGFPQWVDVVNNGLPSGLTTEKQTYTFDPNTARLTQVCYDTNGTCPNTGTNITGVTYGYDAAGNITSKVVHGGAGSPITTNYGYDTANELCWFGPDSGSSCTLPSGNDTAVTYNPNGDRRSDGTTTYTFDLAHRLTQSVGQLTDVYTYDPLGNRYQDQQGGSTTTYTWDSNAAVAHLASTAGSTTKTFFYGGGLQAMKQGTATYYYDQDQTSSVSNILKANGTLQYSYSYQPYGTFRSNKRNDTGQTLNFNPMVYDSEYRDTTTTGLFDLRARMYDPSLGGFLQSDPAGKSPSYAFAIDNPVMFGDPSGFFSWGKALDWFNEHLNPGYAYLQGCFGASASLGRCAFASAGLATTALGLGRLATALTGTGAASAAGTSAESEAAGSLEEVNAIGGTQNCVNCAIAGDATLGGSPACALDSFAPQPISILEDTYGGAFKEVAGQAEIEQLLGEAGPGSRGIVFAAREGAAGHVFNAVNEGGIIRFIDFQAAAPATFEGQGYIGFKFLWTYRP